MSELPRRTTSQNGTAIRTALVFRLGEARLALAADQVASVAEVRSCTRVPSGDRTLLGVARVGRELMPLIDAHRRMGVASPPPAGFPWTCLVVKSSLGDVAFRVDEVLGLQAAVDGLAPPGCTLMPLEGLIEGAAREG